MSITPKDYFTFFLCSYGWSRAPEAVFTFVDELIDLFSWSGQVKVVAKFGPPAREKALLSGSYDPNRSVLLQGKFENVVLSVEGRRTNVYEFFSFFENTRYRVTPDYIRYFSPSVPNEIEAQDKIKIFSFSIGKELFYRRLGPQMDTQLIERVERLFVDLNGVYGYGHETASVISSPYAFIHDNQPASGLRIDEFDYGAYIEEVYLYNFLSHAHVSKLKNIEALHEKTRGVEWKTLRDRDRTVQGLAINLKQYSPDNLTIVRQYLAELLPRSEIIRKSYFLLINKQQLSAVQDIETLKESFLAKHVVIQPYDFAQIEETELLTPLDSVKWTASLQELYRQVYPELKGKKHSVHEDLVQYAGLFNRNHIFQRVPAIGVAYDHYAKLYLGDKMDLKQLKIHFLLAGQLAPHHVEKFTAVVQKWLAWVERNVEHYGKITILEALKIITIGIKLHAYLVVDVTQATQEAVNLLMVMLDEINLDTCIIPYVLLGEMVPPLYLAPPLNAG